MSPLAGQLYRSSHSEAKPQLATIANPESRSSCLKMSGAKTHHRLEKSCMEGSLTPRGDRSLGKFQLETVDSVMLESIKSRKPAKRPKIRDSSLFTFPQVEIIPLHFVHHHEDIKATTLSLSL
jgi:hypothetical protein